MAKCALDEQRTRYRRIAVGARVPPMTVIGKAWTGAPRLAWVDFCRLVRVDFCWSARGQDAVGPGRASRPLWRRQDCGLLGSSAFSTMPLYTIVYARYERGDGSRRTGRNSNGRAKQMATVRRLFRELQL